MSVTEQVTQAQQITLHFFNFLFGQQKGFLCIATASPDKTDFKQHFFEWPEQKSILARFIEEQTKKKNVWFCVNLLRQPERKKEYCLPSAFAWADLDYIIPTHNGDTPEEIPYPSCVVESSPARFQAYWKIEGEPVPPEVAEDFSRKIAYKLGADKSGWDLTQLLRIPWTNNWKYTPTVQVKLKEVEEIAYSINTFDKIQIEAPEQVDSADIAIPPDLPTLDSVLYRYKEEGKITDDFASLYAIAPDPNADWSRILWRFIHECFYMGMTEAEVFVVSKEAACNKYKRDNRPDSYLWRDVRKAAQEHKKREVFASQNLNILTMPHLVDFDEFEEDAFIKDYKVWASQATDAPEQYHELSSFIVLSAIMCSGLYVNVDWGEMVPNLWGLVLGESTLTRKTTAMRLATDMLDAIDPELIVATDGSAEGLLTALSHRPNRVSIFNKDEVAGLFESMKRKDYLAGLPETLTQLYDVPSLYNRVLRKETITIQKPYFIFYGGGIRDKVYSLVNENWITSGFMPRFLVVSGENDLSRFRPTGPPNEISAERKEKLITSLANLRDKYIIFSESEIAGQTVRFPIKIKANLTKPAWEFFQTIENKLVISASESDQSEFALPTFHRLSFHGLKMALLIAASRREYDSSNQLTVELNDVKQAAFYIERWGHYTVDFVLNTGKTESEKALDRALRIIRKNDGLTKGELMQSMHLQSREAKELVDTMSQRGLVDVKPAGRGVRLYIVG